MRQRHNVTMSGFDHNDNWSEIIDAASERLNTIWDDLAEACGKSLARYDPEDEDNMIAVTAVFLLMAAQVSLYYDSSREEFVAAARKAFDRSISRTRTPGRTGEAALS